MKTLKLAMIAAFLSFAMISYAGIDPQKPHAEKVIKISLTQASKVRGLVATMQHQLNIDLIKTEPNGQCSGTVKLYNRYVYRIYGSRASWVRFFLSTSKPTVGTNWLK